MFYFTNKVTEFIIEIIAIILLLNTIYLFT